MVSSTPSHFYVFWAASGKTFSFNRKPNNLFEISRMTKAKMSRQYQEITIDDLRSLWDDIEAEWNTRFAFYLLSAT